MIKHLPILLLLLFSCKAEPKPEIVKVIYSNVVGDIEYDPEVDGDFERCDDNSNQYYGVNDGVAYEGEMRQLKVQVFENFRYKEIKGQTGFYTIRFMVNCKEKTGLFRSYAVDKNLKEFSFSKEISNQLDNLVRGLKGWKVNDYNGSKYDYYQYLTFKLVDGKLKEITP